MIRKAASFALVGVVNTLVDFGLFSFAHLVLGWPIVAANVLSWSIAVTGSYAMNSMFTFAAESGRVLRAKDYFTFLAAQVGGFIANTITVLIVSHILTGFFAAERAVLLAKAAAIGVTFLVNFSLSHFVVFRARAPKSSDAR
jgi:putative flippase GtrA